MVKFISYIKENAGPDFDSVDFFHKCDINDRYIAEDAFKKDVKTVSRWRRCKAQHWAREQINNDFTVSMVYHRAFFQSECV